MISSVLVSGEEVAEILLELALLAAACVILYGATLDLVFIFSSVRVLLESESIKATLSLNAKSTFELPDRLIREFSLLNSITNDSRTCFCKVLIMAVKTSFEFLTFAME